MYYAARLSNAPCRSANDQLRPIFRSTYRQEEAPLAGGLRADVGLRRLARYDADGAMLREPVALAAG